MRVKDDVLATRLRAMRASNRELIGLYWRIGKMILDRQNEQGWGSRVIDRLATDLRRELGERRGWSRSNLFSMRALAAAWPDPAIVQQAVGRLPWGQVTVLLKLEDPDAREWYADQAAMGGWSRKVLEHHIATDLRSRTGPRPTTFRSTSIPTTRTRRARSSRTHTCSTSSAWTSTPPNANSRTH